MSATSGRLEIDRWTRYWIKRLAEAAGGGQLRWEQLCRQPIAQPPLHHLVERIEVPLAGQQRTVRLVRKELKLSDWASSLLQETILREAKWYAADLSALLPVSLELPALEVVWQEEHHAIVLLRDVREDLERWQKARERGMDRALETLARLHNALSGEDVRARLCWLPRYERFFVTAFAQHLAASTGELAAVAGGEELLKGAPDFGAGIEIWLRCLPPRIRTLVTGLWRDPSPILERLRSLPHSVIHGDPGPQHFGLSTCGEEERIVLIDWEFVAWGPPIIDLVHLVLFRQFDRVPSRGYCRSACERYFDSVPDGTWQLPRGESRRMAWELGTALWVLAYGQRHGQALCQVPVGQRPQHPSWVALQQEATLLEEACGQWLR